MRSDSSTLDATQRERPPLVVDLDGTLTPSDTLIESAISLIKQHPLDCLRFPLWLLQGRAALKAAVASRVNFSVESLPIRPELLDYLTVQKSAGRRLILATAAHQDIAERDDCARLAGAGGHDQQRLPLVVPLECLADAADRARLVVALDDGLVDLRCGEGLAARSALNECRNLTGRRISEACAECPQ